MVMSARVVGRMASAAGIVGFVSVASLAIFFAVGEPFGSINDWTVGLLGLLSGLLIVGIEGRKSDGLPAAGVLAAAAGLIGVAVVIIGAGLVISRTTGFVLAGFVESLGFALLGVWLVVANRRPGRFLPVSLSRLGIAAGVLMALGVAVLPAILARTDRMEDVSGLPWLGWVGWLGIFFLYPAWSLLLGRALGGASD